MVKLIGSDENILILVSEKLSLTEQLDIALYLDSNSDIYSDRILNHSKFSAS